MSALNWPGFERFGEEMLERTCTYMIPDLIYDVGMHNGDDTAYYLHLGYRVLAIEADPTLAQLARERFKVEIEHGRLTILNVGVAAVEGEMDFWICDERREWNSFDRTMASREGFAHHATTVPCQRFESILARYGVPYYLKVDIEGHDHLCLAALSAASSAAHPSPAAHSIPDLPQYISVEFSDPALVLTLKSLGFTKFKCIRQTDHSALRYSPLAVVEARLTALAWIWSRRLVRWPKIRRSLGALRRRFAASGSALSASARSTSARSAARWQFTFGSTGPFAEETAGPWLTAEQAMFCGLSHHLGYSKYPEAHLAVWLDLHATR